MNTTPLSEFFSTKSAGALGPSELLPIDDLSLFTALVREASYSLMRNSSDEFVCFVDGDTAREIDSLSNVVMRASHCIVFGSLPGTWTLEAFSEVRCVEVEFEDSDHFFIAISPVGSVAIHWGGAIQSDSIEYNGTGHWTAYRPLVIEAASNLLERHEIDAPRWPEEADSDAAQRMLMGLMSRVVELYEVRQLHVLSDRNDLSAVLEILKSLSARQSSHEIMYTFVEQIAKHVGIDRCSVVRVAYEDGAASVLVSHEDVALQDVSIEIGKYPEIARAVETGEKILINDVTTHALLVEQREALKKSGFRSVLVVPIVLDDPHIGSLLVRAMRRSGGFETGEVSFFEIVAEAGAIALERTELFESLQRSNEDLAHQAATDSLTSLYNRRYFTQRFEQEYSRAVRYDLPLACMMIDIDDFKSLNDRFGHLAGDSILREIADRLVKSTRVHDIVARYGGEEFVAVLPQTGMIGATTQADRLLVKINSFPFSILPGDMKVTVSIGLAVLKPASKEPMQSLLKRADEALYRAKGEGKNRVVIADELE